MKSGFVVFVGNFLMFIFTTMTLSCRHEYKKIPASYHDEDQLIKYVIPDKNYTYWEFCNSSTDTEQVIYHHGIRPSGLKIKPQFSSQLFYGCEPAMCSKYVVCVDNGNVKYVTTTDEFKQFLGSIDNLQEAILLSRTSENLSIDDDIRGGAYNVKADTIYELRLVAYSSCPQTKREVYVAVQKNMGITNIDSLDFYFKSKNCIVY